MKYIPALRGNLIHTNIEFYAKPVDTDKFDKFSFKSMSIHDLVRKPVDTCTYHATRRALHSYCKKVE